MRSRGLVLREREEPLLGRGVKGLKIDLPANDVQEMGDAVKAAV